jgi:hypothetical protein
MAWLLTGNYTIAGGRDRGFLFSFLGDCETGTVFDLLAPSIILNRPTALVRGQTESTRLLDYGEVIGVASVAESKSKIEFT